MRIRIPGIWVGVIWAATCFAGCQRDATPTPDADEPNAAAVTQRQRESALAAQKDLFERLSGRLMSVMSQDGPAAAIKVCSEEALELTRQVGQTHGVTIGRTSFRLRNKQNAPPAWASEWIEQREEEPQFKQLPDGRLGALLPIRLKPQCLLCHGAKEDMADDVKQMLTQTYPDDQATGFEVDALRGWFWVEVPTPE